MPRAIFTFRLPQEQPELDTFLQAGPACSSLAEVARVLRDAEKHGNPTKRERALIEKVREAIDYDALQKAGF